MPSLNYVAFEIRRRVRCVLVVKEDGLRGEPIEFWKGDGSDPTEVGVTM